MQAFGTPDMVFYKLYVACKELKKYLHAVSNLRYKIRNRFIDDSEVCCL